MNHMRQTEHNARRLQTLGRNIARQEAERKTIIRYLSRQGASLRDIAAMSGLSKTTVKRIIDAEES